MTDLIPRIQSIRDELIEARRHITTHPDLVSKALTKLADTLRVIFDDHPEVDVPMSILCDRLASNLNVATRDILACPGMTRAYIDGVLWELAGVVGELERQRDREREFDADIAGAVGVSGGHQGGGGGQ